MVDAKDKAGFESKEAFEAWRQRRSRLNTFLGKSDNALLLIEAKELNDAVAERNKTIARRQEMLKAYGIDKTPVTGPGSIASRQADFQAPGTPEIKYEWAKDRFLDTDVLRALPLDTTKWPSEWDVTYGSNGTKAWAHRITTEEKFLKTYKQGLIDSLGKEGIKGTEAEEKAKKIMQAEAETPSDLGKALSAIAHGKADAANQAWSATLYHLDGTKWADAQVKKFVITEEKNKIASSKRAITISDSFEGIAELLAMKSPEIRAEKRKIHAKEDWSEADVAEWEKREKELTKLQARFKDDKGALDKTAWETYVKKYNATHPEGLVKASSSEYTKLADSMSPITDESKLPTSGDTAMIEAASALDKLKNVAEHRITTRKIALDAYNEAAKSQPKSEQERLAIATEALKAQTKELKAKIDLADLQMRDAYKKFKVATGAYSSGPEINIEVYASKANPKNEKLKEVAEKGSHTKLTLEEIQATTAFLERGIVLAAEAKEMKEMGERSDKLDTLREELKKAAHDHLSVTPGAKPSRDAADNLYKERAKAAHKDSAGKDVILGSSEHLIAYTRELNNLKKDTETAKAKLSGAANTTETTTVTPAPVKGTAPAEVELPKELADLTAANAKAVARIQAIMTVGETLPGSIDIGGSTRGLGSFYNMIDNLTDRYHDGDTAKAGLKDTHLAAVKKKYAALIKEHKSPEDAARTVMADEQHSAEVLKRNTHKFEVILEYTHAEGMIKISPSDKSEQERLTKLKPEYERVTSSKYEKGELPIEAPAKPAAAPALSMEKAARELHKAAIDDYFTQIKVALESRGIEDFPVKSSSHGVSGTTDSVIKGWKEDMATALAYINSRKPGEKSALDVQIMQAITTGNGWNHSDKNSRSIREAMKEQTKINEGAKEKVRTASTETAPVPTDLMTDGASSATSKGVAPAAIKPAPVPAPVKPVIAATVVNPDETAPLRAGSRSQINQVLESMDSPAPQQPSTPAPTPAEVKAQFDKSVDAAIKANPGKGFALMLAAKMAKSNQNETKAREALSWHNDKSDKGAAEYIKGLGETSDDQSRIIAALGKVEAKSAANVKTATAPVTVTAGKDVPTSAQLDALIEAKLDTMKLTEENRARIIKAWKLSSKKIGLGDSKKIEEYRKPTPGDEYLLRAFPLPYIKDPKITPEFKAEILALLESGKEPGKATTVAPQAGVNAAPAAQPQAMLAAPDFADQIDAALKGKSVQEIKELVNRVAKELDKSGKHNKRIRILDGAENSGAAEVNAKLFFNELRNGGAGQKNIIAFLETDKKLAPQREELATLKAQYEKSIGELRKQITKSDGVLVNLGSDPAYVNVNPRIISDTLGTALENNTARNGGVAGELKAYSEALQTTNLTLRKMPEYIKLAEVKRDWNAAFAALQKAGTPAHSDIDAYTGVAAQDPKNRGKNHTDILRAATELMKAEALALNSKKFEETRQPASTDGVATKSTTVKMAPPIKVQATEAVRPAGPPVPGGYTKVGTAYIGDELVSIAYGQQNGETNGWKIFHADLTPHQGNAKLTNADIVAGNERIRGDIQANYTPSTRLISTGRMVQQCVAISHYCDGRPASVGIQYVPEMTTQTVTDFNMKTLPGAKRDNIGPAGSSR